MRAWWIALLILASCDEPPPVIPAPADPPLDIEPPPAPENPNEPTHVDVQHILISFKGAVNKSSVTRTQEEAERLVQKLVARAKKGEDFTALTMQFSDDTPDGKYSMYNAGAKPRHSDDFPRRGMVPSFGDAAFSLKPGEIGVAAYDPEKSKYGWHIIKRLK